VISADGNDPLLQIVSISTLLLFFVSLITLLVIRAGTLKQQSQKID
jgi:hypothetical protein